MMTAFHMLNQNTRALVLERARDSGVGTLIMFAVRRIFSDPEMLRQTIRQLAAAGKVAPELAGPTTRWGSSSTRVAPPASSMPPTGSSATNPASTWCCSARGKAGAREINVASILKPPLPDADRARIVALFGHLEEGVGLTLPRTEDDDPARIAAHGPKQPRSRRRPMRSSGRCSRPMDLAVAWSARCDLAVAVVGPID